MLRVLNVVICLYHPCRYKCQFKANIKPLMRSDVLGLALGYLE